MPIRKTLFISAALFLALTACTGLSKHPAHQKFRILASEKTLPDNFYDISFKRKTPPNFEYLVRRATTSSEFAKGWAMYGFEEKMPKPDLNQKDIFFIGVQESGSCPYTIDEIKKSHDQKTLKVPLSKPEGMCTADATPRAFAIEIDKKLAEGVKFITVVQSEIETHVPAEKL
ncbi:hypothetical protein LRR81_17445 [Metabacillus sp. GX 13764]|uniref:hypothetical protein n=1 Tax=Metabacillus kandeliae TaxID=2900151 RepID=UPI001E2E961E|nr:hypothetical protein [Metabacillus kandeliae]MCD7036028.1 hypothetical protein [Metabacillus kandeliae]